MTNGDSRVLLLELIAFYGLSWVLLLEVGASLELVVRFSESRVLPRRIKRCDSICNSIGNSIGNALLK